MADEVVATDDVKPYRMQFNFTFAHNNPEAVEEMYDAVAESAEDRGLIFEWGVATEMEIEDVIPNSLLANLLAGTEPES